jgi:hypothetical protein
MDACLTPLGLLLHPYPPQPHPRRISALVVLKSHLMVAPRQGDVRAVGGNLVLPAVNEQPIVHPQAHPVVGEEGAAMGTRVKRLVALPEGAEEGAYGRRITMGR